MNFDLKSWGRLLSVRHLIFSISKGGEVNLKPLKVETEQLLHLKHECVFLGHPFLLYFLLCKEHKDSQCPSVCLWATSIPKALNLHLSLIQPPTIKLAPLFWRLLEALKIDLQTKVGWVLKTSPFVGHWKFGKENWVNHFNHYYLCNFCDNHKITMHLLVYRAGLAKASIMQGPYVMGTNKNTNFRLTPK